MTARPATIQDAAELLRSAWAIVEDSGVPEHVQAAALSEVVRILAADQASHQASTPVTPLDPPR
jgi:hypothetical protein